MKAKIYHLTGHGIRFHEHSPEDIASHILDGRYRLAGEVEVGDGNGLYEAAFVLSQNDFEPWASPPCRSTSVGDLIVAGDTLAQVMRIGFDRTFKERWAERCTIKLLDH